MKRSKKNHPVSGKTLKPWLLGAKGDQSLVSGTILRSMNHIKKVDEEPQGRLPRFILGIELEHLHESPGYRIKL